MLLQKNGRLHREPQQYNLTGSAFHKLTTVPILQYEKKETKGQVKEDAARLDLLKERS